HGWEQLTDAAIVALSERPAPVVFILWGRAARDKKRLIDLKRNFVVESAHPSPLSAYRGFFGSRPFSKTNQFLEMTGQAPINWQLPSTVDHL
ncbi:uracil-DNA glycosylase, partial [Limosilactobacillus fermentum]|nr:uracil-DNA glycosylase [Limosilactobacillus fermentum]